MPAAPPGWPRPVFVVGAGVVCPAGLDWRGLAAVAAGATAPPLPAAAPAVPPDRDPCEPRRRTMMSRAAYLGAVALRSALRDAGAGDDGARLQPAGLPLVGFHLGVGASGGELAELEAMLRPSVSTDPPHLDLTRLGSLGLQAANPLFAFQLMNNFTLCHGAILQGLQGPGSAFFSRGAGTVIALREAAFALADGELGDAGRACAGGADTALHPVTTAELERAGLLERGLVPGEGAALLVLAGPGPGRRLARLVRAEVHPALGRPLEEVAAAALAAAGKDATLVLAPWGPPARAALHAATSAWTGPRLDVTLVTGEALAATAALGWAVALDRLVGAGDDRAVILSAGVDGDLGLVELQREPGDG